MEKHPALDDQDESVRIAVRALGDMRSGAHATATAASPSTSFQPTPALSATSRSTSPSLPDEDSQDFVARVSTLPLVNTAIRAYEQGKASSRVVKYGAEMMESSMKAVSRPVIDRLPVGQLDDFACRQLDKLDSYRRRPSNAESPERRSTIDRSPEPSSSGWSSALHRGRDSTRDRDVSMVREDVKMTTIPESNSRTPTPRQDNAPESNENQQQVAQRSRWQAMLLEAGGIGAAVSEESMRRLKYCLQWLQYATAHIDAQILVLRDFIVSLQTHSSSSNSTPLTEQHLQTLTSIRRDVVDTIRQVVDVVSKYAGGALPEPARVRVRSFILCLPQRWAHAAPTTLGGAGSSASVNGADTKKDGMHPGRGRGRAAAAPYSYGPGEAGPSPHSRPASRATSPSSLRTHAHARNTGGVPPTAGAATQAAQKILTLATESLDMLRSVTGVFKESLDKADAWVERLRIVGVQRQPSSAFSDPNAPTLPPPSSLEAYREPLPPIQLTPGSSRAHSPVSAFAQLQLPPLDPTLFNGGSNIPQNGTYRRVGHGDPAKDFDGLTLRSATSSRYSTPRVPSVGLPSGDDGGGLGKDSSRMEVDL